jgi:hypothetical protein
MILATPAAAAEIPVNPKIAAINATTKKINAQLSIAHLPFATHASAEALQNGQAKNTGTVADLR